MASFSREFSILGQKVVIQNQTEADLASVALKLVNEKLAEIHASKPLLGPNQVAVLALLEIAGNLVKDRKSIDHYREELDKKCSHLMNELARFQSRDLERSSS